MNEKKLMTDNRINSRTKLLCNNVEYALLVGKR